MEAGLLQDPAACKCITGWAVVILKRDWCSCALTFTWDLDAHNPSYLLQEDGGPDPCLLLSLEHRRATERNFSLDNVGRWVLVKFQCDPGEWQALGWSLLTSRMGAVLLTCCLTEADTRCTALSTLVAVGVPTRIGILHHVHANPPCPSNSEASHVSKSDLGALPAAVLQQCLLKVWCEKEEQPTVKDYDTYCQCMREFSHQPHVHTAWLKGGIMWWIMLEVTDRNTNLPMWLALEEELSAGPSWSGRPEYYEPVTQEANGTTYFDDALSTEELDIVSGVVKVYTGERFGVTWHSSFTHRLKTPFNW